LDAIRIKKVFSSAHIGIIGYRAKGFFNLDIDELDLYRETGILIDHYELSEIFNFKVDKELISKRKEQIGTIFDISSISDHQLDKVSELTAKFSEFMNYHHLVALAIRCWPEFASDFGISPCAAMSILQSEGMILACEGDILGALSMLAHKAIGGETPFLSDFSQVNFQDDFGLLWHCGVAACNLWDKKCNISLDSYFAEGKGVTADFVMKSGELSLLRLDYSPGEYRIFLQKGKGIPMEKELKGTYVKVEFEDNIRVILDKIINNGIAHHISVVYGDFVRPLEIYAKLMEWKVIK
jgi:L-fucose isomerase-like protein